MIGYITHGAQDDDLAAAIATSNSTLLAAVITAAVAAAVFLVGEILKIHREKVNRQIQAVSNLLDAWEKVAAVSSPRVDKWWWRLRGYSEEVSITARIARLPAVLPRRDFELITLQFRLNDQLVAAPRDLARVAAAGDAVAILTVWLANRRLGRQGARARLVEMGVVMNFEGSPARRSAPPKRAF